MPPKAGRTYQNYELATEEAPPEAGPREEDPPPPPPKKRGFGFFKRKKEEQEMTDAPVEYTDDNLPTANAVLDEVIQVKKETIDAVQRTERIIYETEAIGQESLQAISKNREQIKAVDDALVQMEPVTNRARRDVGIFARRLFRDKCFLCLFTLVLLAAVGVILAVTVFKPDDDDPVVPLLPNATSIDTNTSTTFPVTTLNANETSTTLPNVTTTTEITTTEDTTTEATTTEDTSTTPTTP